MAKVRNKSIYSTDVEYLKRLAEEFDLMGRDYKLDLRNGVITQYALPRRKAKKKADKPERNKRSEKFERRA